MIYARLTSKKNRVYIKSIVIIVLSAFLTSLCSCYTVSEQTITVQELKVLDEYHIIDAKMKNDSIIYLEKFEEVTFSKEPNYSGAEKEILKFTKNDTNITVNKGQKEFRFRKQHKELSADSIVALKISIKETDVLMSLLAVSVITIGVILILGMLAVGQMSKGMSSFRFGE